MLLVQNISFQPRTSPAKLEARLMSLRKMTLYKWTLAITISLDYTVGLLHYCLTFVIKDDLSTTINVLKSTFTCCHMTVSE